MLRAGASSPAVSSKRHPGPQGLGGSGSRSLQLTRSLELTASALGSDGWPLPERTRRASGAGRKPNPCSGASRRPKPDGPRVPGRDLPVASPAPAGRGRTAAGRRGANFYTYFLFRFGFGVAAAPPRRDPDTDFPPTATLPDAPRALHQLFGELSSHPRRSKRPPKVAPRQSQQQ